MVAVPVAKTLVEYMLKVTPPEYPPMTDDNPDPAAGQAEAPDVEGVA